MTRKIFGSGINQGDLVYLLNEIVTNFNAALAKLDADGGVTDTDYVEDCGIDVTASGVIIDTTGV